MSQDLFQRMRLVAFGDATLRSFFGADFATFRFFDRERPQGYERLGTCARVTSISQTTDYTHTGRMGLTGDRMQIDIIDADPTRASDAADAVAAWLDKADFVNNGATNSPVRTTPWSRGNTKLNQRGGLFPATERMIPSETLDYRIFNVQPT